MAVKLTEDRKKFEEEVSKFLISLDCSADVTWPKMQYYFDPYTKKMKAKAVQSDFHNFFDIDVQRGPINRKIQVSSGTRRALNNHKEKLDGWPHSNRPILWHFWKLQGRIVPDIQVRVDGGTWEYIDILEELEIPGDMVIERLYPWVDYITGVKSAELPKYRKSRRMKNAV